MSLSQQARALDRGVPPTGRRAVVGAALVGVGVINRACTPLIEPAFGSLVTAALTRSPEASVLLRRRAVRSTEAVDG